MIVLVFPIYLLTSLIVLFLIKKKKVVKYARLLKYVNIVHIISVGLFFLFGLYFVEDRGGAICHFFTYVLWGTIVFLIDVVVLLLNRFSK